MHSFNWNYNPDDYNTNASGILAEGDYRVCISSAVPTVAKTGTHGLEISLDVNGITNSLKHYIWFNPDDVRAPIRNLVNSLTLSTSDRTSKTTALLG